MRNNLLKLKVVTCLLLLCFASCKEEHEDVAPGIYSNFMEEVLTFPGDTVLLTGTASNYVGLSTVSLKCPKWKIEKVYDLNSQKPVVFNYDYKLIVPADATFDEVLSIEVKDKNGLSSLKEVSMKFLPDTQKPSLVTKLQDVIPLDFDIEVNKAIYNLKLRVYDDRALKSLRIQIAGTSLDQTITLSGRDKEIAQLLEFTGIGNFPLTITIEDMTGNKTVIQKAFSVIPKEDADPYSDYAQMYVINTSLNPDNYLMGYYRYMKRKDAYQYTANIYAPKDNTPIAFVAEESIEKDYFGVSPYASNKLLNKNGYVKPILLKKGYYTVEIDIKNGSFTIANLTPATDAYTGDLSVVGTGFSFADWTLSSLMTLVDAANPYCKEITVGVGNPLKIEYAFCGPGWNPQWKSNGKEWYKASSGANISFAPGNVTQINVTFDTVILWSTVEKK